MDAEETRLYHSLLVAGLILAGIVCYFLYSIIRYQKKHRKITRAHIEQEFNLIEAERQRISYDLHDDLGPYLSAAFHKLQIIDTHSEVQEALKQECMTNINIVVEKLQNIAWSLLPYALKAEGPVSAIRDFIRDLKSERLKVELQYSNIPSFTEMQAVHIYRLMQEIIHNSLKHAKPGRLKILLETTEQSFIIKSADEGWDEGAPANSRQGKGLGAEIMAGRVMQLKGEMNVDLHPTLGTRYEIVIPLTAKINNL